MFPKKGIPKWMVKIMENPIKIDDFGVLLLLETPVLIEVYMILSRNTSHKSTKSLLPQHSAWSMVQYGDRDMVIM